MTWKVSVTKSDKKIDKSWVPRKSFSFVPSIMHQALYYMFKYSPSNLHNSSGTVSCMNLPGKNSKGFTFECPDYNYKTDTEVIQDSKFSLKIIIDNN